MNNFRTFKKYEQCIDSLANMAMAGRPSVHYAYDTGEVVYRRKHTPEVKFGEVIWFDESGAMQHTWYRDFDSSAHTAEALCVIPSNLLGDGYARCIALTDIADEYGTAGSNASMPWYNDKSSYSKIDLDRQYTRLPSLYTSAFHSLAHGYAPMDYFNDVQSQYSGSLCYNDEADRQCLVPSLYLSDWSLNPDAYKQLHDGNNILTDIAGLEHTLSLAGKGNENYEAALGCSRYSTANILSGKWHLPAMGELALMFIRFNEINSMLRAAGGGCTRFQQLLV